MEQFKHNELTFNSMIEAVPNALILVNKLGKITYVNSFAEEMFVYKKNELVGQDLTVLIPNKYSKHHLSLMQSYFTKPVRQQMGGNKEFNAVKKGGKEFPVEIGLNPISTADGTMALAVVIDISIRKRTEKQFQLIVESVPNAIILVNQKGEIVLANKQAETSFGYTNDELTGKKLEILIPERYRKNHMSYRNMFLAQPKARAMGEGRDLFALRKNGTEFPAEIGLTPIKIDEDNLILTSVIDISRRKKLEDSIQNNTERITKQNYELKLSELKLKELNATKDKLFSVIAHDLKTPFHLIQGLIQLLSLKLDSEGDADKKDLISELKESSQTTYTLLENLLSWARSQQGSIAINKEEINLEEHVLLGVAPYKSNLRKKNININIDIPKNHMVNVDKHTMGIVISNIVNNAFKFTQDGGSIHISSNLKSSQVELVIKDDGVGMNKKQKSNLFKIAESISTLGTNKEQGSGLGLVLCKEFVEMNGGNIRLESEIGQGTTFIITLPMEQFRQSPLRATL